MKKISVLLFVVSIFFLMGCNPTALIPVDIFYSNEKVKEYCEEGNFEAALEYINERIEKFPRDSALYAEKGYILLELGNPSEALPLIEHALEKNPNFDAALNNKAWALNELGRYEEAVEFARRAIEIKPNYDVEFLNMGNALLSLDREKEAITYFDEALAINPNSYYAMYGKGVAYFFLREYDEALQAFYDYDKLMPGDTDALRYLMYTHDYIGDIEAALAVTDQILEIDETLIDVHYYKGMILADLNEWDLSLSVYRNMIDSFPEDPSGYYGKSRIFVQMYEVDAGLAHLRSAIELDGLVSEWAREDEVFYEIWDNEEFLQVIGY